MVGGSLRRGFTLIEILVVISIIGILSTVGLITYSGTQTKARDSVRKGDLRTLAIALEIYNQQNGQYVPPPASIESTSCNRDTLTFYQDISPYLSGNRVPKDPKTNQNYCYISENNGQGYRLFAKLEDCTDADIIQNIDCPKADYNFSVVAEDLTIASVPTYSTPSTPTSACADGSDDQVYLPSFMAGCNGFVDFDGAAALCANGFHLCTINEYLNRGGDTMFSRGGAYRWINAPIDLATSERCTDNTTAYASSTSLFESLTSYASINYFNACNQNRGYFIWNYTNNLTHGAMCCSNLTPPSLATPTTSKRVFVTSTTYNGNLGSLSGADSKCQARADAANLGGSWKAWLSDTNTTAAQRLTHSRGSYKLIDGAVVAHNWADLTDGSLVTAINLTELGSRISDDPTFCQPSDSVWTKTSETGSNDNTGKGGCNNWTSELALRDVDNPNESSAGLVGKANRSSRGWTAWCGRASCSQFSRLYCFEQ